MSDSDWDIRYSNSLNVKDFDRYLTLWSEESEKYRSNSSNKLDIAYANGARNIYDVFHGDKNSQDVVIFVHGGCWIEFSKSDWSYLGRELNQCGWNFAIPSYTLCPDKPLAELGREIVQSIEHVASHFSGKIILVGHSAGAHLVTRAICKDSGLSTELLSRIEKVIGISGLYDLRPIALTSMNDSIRLDNAQAYAESPVLKEPIDYVSVMLLIGEEELPDFHAQTEALLNVWQTLGCSIDRYSVLGKNHFNVLDCFLDADGKIMELIYSLNN